MVFALHAQLKHYDWGVPGALSHALGREPSGAPEAEVWWGDHPLSDCVIHASSGPVDFPSWLENTETTFPLLVKLLAAQKPLSIQVHPSEHQARLGFDREQAQDIPLGAYERTYKDPFAKPELIIALSDEFVGLAGFAQESKVRDRLARWLRGGAPQSLGEQMTLVAGEPRAAARLIFDKISDHSGVVLELEQWLGKIDPSDLDGETSQEVQLLQQVSSAHPGDSGVLFVLLMHHVYLQRGEALFVPAGEVHAYIEGMGLEVMLPSDNVIRGGLTSKHKDVDAFLTLSNFSPTSSPTLVTPQGDSLRGTYQGFGAGFSVHRVLSGAEEFTVVSPSVCFVESGQAFVQGPEDVTLQGGDVVLALPGETITADRGESVVWIVHPERN